jgi:hypothetical protein
VRELVDPLAARHAAVPLRRLRARTGAPGVTEFLFVPYRRSIRGVRPRAIAAWQDLVECKA